MLLARERNLSLVKNPQPLLRAHQLGPIFVGPSFDGVDRGTIFLPFSWTFRYRSSTSTDQYHDFLSGPVIRNIQLISLYIWKDSTSSSRDPCRVSIRATRTTDIRTPRCDKRKLGAKGTQSADTERVNGYRFE